MFIDIDTTDVVLRRRHKTTLRMYRNGSADSEETEMDSSESERTDNLSDLEESIEEDDDEGSVESNPFGFVKYYTGKKSPSESTQYESFIDHGEDVDGTEHIFDKILGRNQTQSSMNVDRDSDGSFCFKAKKKSVEVHPRDSLPICSQTIKLADTKTPSRESVVHTSTARLNMGELKQQYSQQSEFDNRLPGMACEDLVNLDDSMRIKNVLKQKTLMDERHSMPTLFVGNRFNNSSSTKVYIPSWKDKQDIQKQSVCDHDNLNRDVTPVSSRSSTSTTTHSSSIDLPASYTVLPVPDKITAELLYNFDQSIDKSDSNIIKPPSMFNNVSLSRDMSPFSTHSLNSDLKITTKSRKNSISVSKSPKRDSVRRCISYQYVRLNNTNNTKVNDKCCTCCNGSRCHSPRSSDSGMAGSCTIASPDPPNKTSDEFYYPFEYDMIGLRHSRSSHNLGRFNFTSLNDNVNKNEKDNTDSGQYGDSSLVQDEILKTSDNKIKTSNLSLNLRISNINDMFELSTSRDTVKRQSRCRSIERDCNILDSFNEEDTNEIIQNNNNCVEFHLTPDPEKRYRTGLYAHWWKKEKLPIEILRELYRLKKNNFEEITESDDGDDDLRCRRSSNNNNNCGDSVGHHPVNNGEGSGKIML